MSMRRFSRRERGQRGGASVEMALIAPFLLFLVMGVIDLGRVLFTAIAIREAAQEGAMFAAYDPDDYNTIRTRVISSLDSPSLAANDVTVTCPLGVDGGEIEVSVTHDVDLLTPIAKTWFGNTITLNKGVRANIYSDDPCDPSP